MSFNLSCSTIWHFECIWRARSAAFSSFLICFRSSLFGSRFAGSTSRWSSAGWMADVDNFWRQLFCNVGGLSFLIGVCTIVPCVCLIVPFSPIAQSLTHPGDSLPELCTPTMPSSLYADAPCTECSSVIHLSCTLRFGQSSRLGRSQHNTVCLH